MVKALDKVCSFFSLLAGLILIFITLSIGYSIFTRAIGIRGIVWVVQFSEYALLWMTFLGTAWLVAKSKHVSVHIILEHLNEKGKRVFFIYHALLGMVLCALLCWFTALTTIEKIQRHVIDVQAVDLPIGYVLAVIPLGFFLLFLQFIRKLFEAVRGTRIKLTETETL